MTFRNVKPLISMKGERRILSVVDKYASSNGAACGGIGVGVAVEVLKGVG